MTNRALNEALYYRQEPDDEYYTQYEDIVAEMKHYTDFLRGKKVLCPCDDVNMSEFPRYFSEKYSSIGLAGLRCVGYSKDSQICDLYEYDGTTKKFGIGNWNGDYRAKEAQELFAWCDVVITNPPFSQLRPMVEMLFEYGKHFIIIGNSNTLHTNLMFELIRKKLLQAGHTQPKVFDTPTGKKKLGFCCWLTNTGLGVGEKWRELTTDYDEKNCVPIDDNPAIIRVHRLKHIPRNYSGLMVVPYTLLLSGYGQFELLGLLRPHVNGKEHFTGILCRFKQEYLDLI